MMRWIALFAMILLAAGCVSEERVSAMGNGMQNGTGTALSVDGRSENGEGPVADTDDAQLESGHETDFGSGQAEVQPDSESVEAEASQDGTAGLDFSKDVNESGNLIAYFFYSSRCSACEEVMPIIGALEAEHNDMEFRKYDLAEEDGWDAYNEFCRSRGIGPEKRYVPQVMVNGTLITAKNPIRDGLPGLLQNLSSGASAS